MHQIINSLVPFPIPSLREVAESRSRAHGSPPVGEEHESTGDDSALDGSLPCTDDLELVRDRLLLGVVTGCAFLFRHVAGRECEREGGGYDKWEGRLGVEVEDVCWKEKGG